MWKRGEIAGHQLPSGTVIVETEESTSVVSPRVAVYARVSSTENKKKLETQAERLVGWCEARGWSVKKVLKECGSGVNDQRPQFLALLTDPSISHLVVEHKDRASHFGVAYIQALMKMQGRELVIVNGAETEEDDLMGDFVAIITSFCARLYGDQRARRKMEQVLSALEQNSRNDEETTEIQA